MNILPDVLKKNKNLPLKIKVSFEAIFEYLELTALNKEHYLFGIANEILEEFKEYPELREGFENYDYLKKYNKQIDKLLEIIFPEILQNDEIKAISIPFDFITFKLSKRFQRIIDGAGENFKLKLRHFDESKRYISACIFILVHYYKVKLQFERPFYFDIPDIKKGFIRNYRAKYNKDFFTIKKLSNAPKITDNEIKELLDNFNNIEIWKEKFPLHSYEFIGFGVINMFDVTSDQLLTDVKENLLRTDERAFLEMEKSISNLFGSNSIKFEFSTYFLHNNELAFRYYYNQSSFIVQGKDDFDCDENTCDDIYNKVFVEKKMLAISNVEKYGKKTNYNRFYKSLKKKGVKSIILVPLILTDELFGIMELISTEKYELNSINAEKLKDVIPAFKVGALRYMEEYINNLESIIQEHYTSLHPSVKWKFYKAAESHLSNLETNNMVSSEIKSIVFKNVIPLYGQCDIKGSSIERSKAVQQDLSLQLNFVRDILKKAIDTFNLSNYKPLLTVVEEYLSKTSSTLKTNEEEAIINFLKVDINKEFSILKTLEINLKEDIKTYRKKIDKKLQVFYQHRKKYDHSVNELNEKLTNYLDNRQVSAQKMFSHYFERYKTDGVDYTMYMGKSLIKSGTYKLSDLHNLRLWQLETMCEIENIAYHIKDKLEHPLEVCSLILVHNSPLAIRFRMSEKRFDIDGAQNVRFEIIKKRIDKSYIKNTKNRLTIPGKIAIVYSRLDEQQEYMNYIKQLQLKNYLLEGIEKLEVEDTVGVSGLKALRIGVNYNANMEV